MSSIPQPQHHQLRNINIFKQLLPLMCFTTFSRSHVLMFKILLLMAFLTTKNSDNTKTPNHRNYQLINASNYWSIFPRKNSFSSLSLFLGIVFSLLVCFIYPFFRKKINFALLYLLSLYLKINGSMTTSNILKILKWLDILIPLLNPYSANYPWFFFTKICLWNISLQPITTNWFADAVFRFSINHFNCTSRMWVQMMKSTEVFVMIEVVKQYPMHLRSLLE